MDTVSTILILAGFGWVIAIAGMLTLFAVGKRNDDARHRAMRGRSR